MAYYASCGTKTLEPKLAVRLAVIGNILKHLHFKQYFNYTMNIILRTFNTIITKYSEIKFKYNLSSIYILHSVQTK